MRAFDEQVLHMSSGCSKPSTRLGSGTRIPSLRTCLHCSRQRPFVFPGSICAHFASRERTRNRCPGHHGCNVSKDPRPSLCTEAAITSCKHGTLMMARTRR